MIGCVSYSNSWVIFARASTLLSHIIWSTLSKYYICHCFALAFSVCYLWFYFLIVCSYDFSENQIWFGTRQETKISFSSTQDTCFPLLDSTLYPQETLFGDVVIRTTPLPTINSLIPLISSQTKRSWEFRYGKSQRSLQINKNSHLKNLNYQVRV